MFLSHLKNLLKKCEADGKDFWAALLAYRTTPLSNSNYSPAEILKGRNLRSRLTSHKKPNIVPTYERSNIEQPKYEEKYSNQHSRELKELNIGDTVRIWKDKKWKVKATVIHKFEDIPRSYIVEAENGRRYRRNRINLLRTTEMINRDLYHHEELNEYEDDAEQRNVNDDEDNMPNTDENDVNWQQNFNEADYRRFSTRNVNK